MKRATAIRPIAAVVLLVLGALACQPDSGGGGGADSDQATTVEGAGEHVAQGTLNSIDADRGTVNISHEAVESAGWPAMTMDFRLTDTEAARDLTPGQRVRFHFTTEGGGTVTDIEPLE